MARMGGIRQIGTVLQVGLPQGVASHPVKPPGGHPLGLRLELPGAQSLPPQVPLQSRAGDLESFTGQELLDPFRTAPRQLLPQSGRQLQGFRRNGLAGPFVPAFSGQQGVKAALPESGHVPP